MNTCTEMTMISAPADVGDFWRKRGTRAGSYWLRNERYSVFDVMQHYAKDSIGLGSSSETLNWTMRYGNGNENEQDDS
jgi:hypothetical protein